MNINTDLLLSIMVLLYTKFISSNSFCVGRYVL
jgi:hypothetical protein